MFYLKSLEYQIDYLFLEISFTLFLLIELNILYLILCILNIFLATPKSSNYPLNVDASWILLFGLSTSQLDTPVLHLIVT